MVVAVAAPGSHGYLYYRVKETCDFWSIFRLCGMQDLLKGLNTADQVQNVSVSLQHSKDP